MSEQTYNAIISAGVDAIKFVGFPIVACLMVGWMYHQTVAWEREQMLPAIEKQVIVIEKNNTIMTQVDKTLTDLVKHLEAIEK